MKPGRMVSASHAPALTAHRRAAAGEPHIGIALTKAYLPDATAGQLLAAGLSARGEK